MGQKEVDELRKLIKKRAELLGKVKKAKGKTLATAQEELRKVQSRISVLDEQQR